MSSSGTPFTPTAPATDWFFVHTAATGHKVVHRVAYWAQTTEGHIIGLMAVRGEPLDSARHIPVSLVPIPVIEGCYVHKEDLTQRERATLETWRKEADC